MQSAATRGTETTTIMEFLAESPHVDVSRAWERCWNIQAKIGTIPKLYFYAEYTPRVDLRTNDEYLLKSYEPANAEFPKFRSDPSWTRFVSRGPYLRDSMSPIASRPSITRPASWVIATTR